MSIQFSGLVSGLDTGSIIEKLMSIEQRPLDLLANRKNTLNTKNTQFQSVASRLTSLATSLRMFTDAKLGTSSDLFQSRVGSTSNSTTVGITVSNGAIAGSTSVAVTKLATATRAASTQPVGSATALSTPIKDISEGTITAGNFTVFINGQAKTIAVDPTTQSVQDVLNSVTTEANTVLGGGANVNATLDAQGKIQISNTAGGIFKFGAVGDTSTFALATKLTTGTQTGANFSGSSGTNTVYSKGTLIGNAARLANNTIAAGTFKINGASFTISATTTLADAIGAINNSSTANVRATFDTTQNKLVLTSKVTGQQAISLDSNGTNFFESVGLITGGDSLASQTLGDNAEFSINGGLTLSSTSNSVGSDITGLTGVTLNIVGLTNAVPATLDVKQDSTKITTQIKDLITKFNGAIAFIDEQTAKDAALQGENGLRTLRNSLRSQLASGTPANDVGGVLTPSPFLLKSLADIGISTGAVTATVATGQSPSSTFTLDETKFAAALANNPDEVKKLLVGDGTFKGILSVVETTVKAAQDTEFGLFSTRSKAVDAQIKSINEAIAKGQTRLAAKKLNLQKQFSTMENLISQYKNQSSSLASLNTTK